MNNTSILHNRLPVAMRTLVSGSTMMLNGRCHHRIASHLCPYNCCAHSNSKQQAAIYEVLSWPSLSTVGHACANFLSKPSRLGDVGADCFHSIHFLIYAVHYEMHLAQVVVVVEKWSVEAVAAGWRLRS